ncbi:MAG: flagellar protein FlgN [Subdoligranulum sp.]|nr:flagellar protein FlgN [Subdoligranulum sp.]
MAQPFEEYRAFLEHYASFLEEMSAQSQGLHGALASFNGEQLTKAMSGVQSHIMQLKNLEARRVELQREAGYDGLTFAQMIGQRPEAERPALKALCRRIEMCVENIRYFNEKSQAFAKEGLASVQGSGQVTQGGNLYAPPVHGKDKRLTDAPAAFEAKY